jgi:formiminotetrahydrofolate cyclodeaminase
MKASGLPKETAEQLAARDAAVQAELKNAALVPLKTIRIASSCWDTLLQLAEHGSMNAKSDLEVATRSLELAIWGAQRNVAINVEAIADKAWASEMVAEAEKAVDTSKKMVAQVLEILSKRKAD